MTLGARGPYFPDGLVPLAYLLDGAHLQAKTQKFIDWTLNNQAANGMLGPRSNDDWWPRIVKVLAQYHEATVDPRVIPAMQRYFEYQLAEIAPTETARLGETSLAGRSAECHLALQPYG